MSALERPRRAARRRAALLALAIGIPGITACLGMRPALAHDHMHKTPQAPMYITSDPQAGATVSSASRVTVTFNQPLDASSTLKVLDHCGDRVDAGRAQITANQISISIEEPMAPSGKYIVLYTAVGLQGLTGRTINGFTFTATDGMSCGMMTHMGGGSSMHGGGHMGGDGMGGDMGSMGSDSHHGSGMSMGMNGSGVSGDMHAMDMSNDASSRHGMHGMKALHGHGMHGMHMTDGNKEPPPSASGALSAFELRPSGTMALIALGLAGALGGLGGIVLRFDG
ncbi:MAG: copper resistance protein CopC [Actinomycetota bacterium]|nr:copper resistance protein CopC [Actinomycetota bacterium]